MKFPSLTSLVWPAIVLGALVALFYIAVSTKIANSDLKRDVGELKTQLTAMQAQVDKAAVTNTGNTIIYEQAKKDDQQLLKDAGRSHLLIAKPGLVEIKINKSFDDYMSSFDQ